MLGFFTVVLFLMTTSGFTVYTHLCSSTLSQKQSLIESLADCGHHKEQFDLQINNDLTTCCNSTHSCEIQLKANNCCLDLKQYYKITDVYIVNSDEETDKHLTSEKIVKAYVTENVELGSNINESILHYSLPPPISGKQKVLLYHQIKTDPDPAV